MPEYVILTDSCCDLPAELAESLKIVALPLIVNIDNLEYNNYLDERELALSDFYGRLKKGSNAFTSAANVNMFIELMTPYLEKGVDVIYIGLSSACSATYQNSCIAAEELREKYPDRNIICIDSRSASLGQGLILYLAAKARDEGKTIHELNTYVEETIPHICHWFTVDDLHFLKRGGRISSATACFGSVLHIKPILRVNNEGKIVSYDKARGRKAAIKAIFNKLKETATNIDQQTIMICHAVCLDEAEYLSAIITEAFNPAEIIINPIGPVVGTHGGPGAIGVFFIGTKR